MSRSRFAVLALCFGTVLALPAAAGVDAALPASLSPAPPACQVATAGLSDLLELPGAAPAPLELNHCNAQQTCSSGCFISCTGHSSCTVTSTSVTCDGVTTNCPFPGCTPSPSCLDPCGYCECRASGGGAVQCGRAYCVDCWPPISCL